MKRFLVLCALFLFLPIASRAAAPTYIGEVAWAASNASTADEWFELCGPPGADLSGWTIEGAGTGNSTLTLPAGSVMPPRGAFVVSNYGNDDPKSTLSIAPDWVTTSVALSNSALFMTLRDASGTIVDTAGRSGTAPLAGVSGSAKASMERLFLLADGGAAEAWATAATSVGFDAGATESGTPGSCPAPSEEAPTVQETSPEPVEEMTPPASEMPTVSATETPPTDAAPVPDVPATPIDATPATTPVPSKSSPALPVSAVRISEAYPSPNAGEHEWIELVNPSDIGESLDGWTIEDGKGGATALGGMLLPWGRTVVVSPKGQLNNEGDLVVLKDASGRVLDAIAYGVWDSAFPNVGEVRKGESLIRLELQDAFAVTTTPTPNAPNVLTERAKAAKAPEARPADAPVAAAVVPPAAVAKPSSTVASVTLPPVRPAEVQPKKAEAPAVKKKTVAAKKPAASKYKGAAYLAVVASPPGVYSKTRMFALIDGTIREVRLSKSSAARYAAGARIAFVAQEKTDGADPYLLANPNSIRLVDASASATFAAAEAWPESAGPYRLNAEVVSMQAGVLEAKLGGIEGDVLAPASLTSSLKPGDLVSVEGYVSPGPRPRVVLARNEALTLFKAYQSEAGLKTPVRKLPWQAVAFLTFLMALVGTSAYLRHQRLQRLALVLTPMDKDEEPW